MRLSKRWVERQKRYVRANAPDPTDPSPIDRIAENPYAKYRDDPVGFARDVLGLLIWDQQAAILSSVLTSDSVTVRSGHKVGKTCMAITLALWWIATRPGRRTKVIVTAPSLPQTKNILWAELDVRWMSDAAAELRANLGGELPKDPRTGFVVDSGARIIGVSGDKPENIAGLSGKDVLIIIDEASGYPDALFRALEGNTGGDATMVAISNPTKTSGWFFESHQPNSDWAKYAISSEDTPNVRAGKKIIPGMATTRYIEKMRARYGPNPELNANYQIRVLGQFPDNSENQAVSYSKLMGAIGRYDPTYIDESARLTIGVDPAWYGTDDAVVLPVRGRKAEMPTILSGVVDEVIIADAVVQQAQLHRRMPQDDHVVVVVDGVSAGAATVAELRNRPECRSGFIRVVVHLGSEPAQLSKKYSNRRTEVYMEINQWLEDGMVPPVDALKKELLAPQYGYDKDNRYQLESKKSVRKRLGSSPNIADALTMAVSQGDAAIWRIETMDDEDWDDAGHYL